MDAGVPTGTDTALDAGAEDTAIVDQPTAVEGADTAVETGVDGAATSTSTADATAPTESATGNGEGDDNDKRKSALQKLIELFKNHRINKPNQAPEATTPVEQPATAKRWMKEHY